MKRRPTIGRRTEIADAILRVAGREGIGALTMERLGREVGITSGALFRHFPSRTAMLNEAAHRAVILLEATFPSSALPPLERLHGFVAARSRLAAEHGGIPQLVFSEQFGKALPPTGASSVRGIVLRTHDFLVEAFREAAACGDIRRDIPAQELALFVIGAIIARTLFATFADNGPDKHDLDGEAAWNSLLSLLRLPAGPSEISLKKGSKP